MIKQHTLPRLNANDYKTKISVFFIFYRPLSVNQPVSANSESVNHSVWWIWIEVIIPKWYAMVTVKPQFAHQPKLPAYLLCPLISSIFVLDLRNAYVGPHGAISITLARCLIHRLQSKTPHSYRETEDVYYILNTEEIPIRAQFETL